MKCIIDISVEWCGDHGVLRVPYKVQDAVHWFNTGIDMEPYDESDTAEQAWKIAQDILKDPGNDGMLNGELNDCFGTDDIYLIGAMSYAEVKAKYDAWQEQKSKIRVGDEIRNGGVYGIVTLVEKKADGICYHVVGNDGYVWYLNDLVTKKTGRHFPQVAELLEKMKEPK